MAFTAPDIAPYLLRRGIVTARSIVDGDWMVVDVSRRNRNFLVLRREDPGYLVKQVRLETGEARLSVEREATLYWLVENDPRLAALEPLLPTCLGYDAERRLLVVEVVPSTESLQAHQARHGTLRPEVAAALGRHLAAIQRSASGLRPQDGGSAFPGRPPWVLAMPHIEPATMQPLSPANAQLLATVRADDGLRGRLDTLRGEYRVEALIHGDLKLDNALLVEGDGIDVRLVDWELVDFGDLAWDPATVLQSLWTMPMLVTPVDPRAPLRSMAHSALPFVRPAVTAFWSSYARALGLAGEREREHRRRCVRYGAARMLQAAYEALTYADAVTPHAPGLVAAAGRILEDPEAFERCAF